MKTTIPKIVPQPRPTGGVRNPATAPSRLAIKARAQAQVRRRSRPIPATSQRAPTTVTMAAMVSVRPETVRSAENAAGTTEPGATTRSTRSRPTKRTSRPMRMIRMPRRVTPKGRRRGILGLYIGRGGGGAYIGCGGGGPYVGPERRKGDKDPSGGNPVDAYGGMMDRLLESIRGREAKVVGLQYPVGLRTRAVDFAREIESRSGVRVLISAEPSFGACDIAEMPVDLTVHLGHAPMPHLRYKNVFFFDLPQAPPEDWTFLEKALPLLAGKRVGILTTTQHRTWVPAISARLREKGFTAVVSEPDRRVAYAGQVLGCDYFTATSIEADVDAYLYVGSGDFHPIGVSITCKKPIVVADPTNREARTLEDLKDRILRQRHAAIARAAEAKVFGIIVSRKIGQDRSGVGGGGEWL